MLTSHTKKEGCIYRGVVRRAGKVVFVCNHVHANRDTDNPYYGGVSANTCACVAVDQLERSESPTGKSTTHYKS